MYNVSTYSCYAVRLCSKRWLNSKRCYSSSKNLGHIPVMAEEVVKYLDPQPSQVLLDMTFGAGGHTRALLKKIPTLKCFCLDRDPNFETYFEKARTEMCKSSDEFIPMPGKFSDLAKLCREHDLRPGTVDMIVMDLGISSMQLDTAARGFGAKSDGPLDMRMDEPQSESLTASKLINHLDASELARLFKVYGEERYARRIANAILEYRNTLGPLTSTQQLTDIIATLVPNREGSASRTIARIFQALRIFVNDELNELCSGLSLAERLLKPNSADQSSVTNGRGGRLAVISFHSLEDRLVKWTLAATQESPYSNTAVRLAERTTFNNAFHRREELLRESGLLKGNSWEKNASQWKGILGPLTPSVEEIDRNSRSRSAKLRIGEKM